MNLIRAFISRCIPIILSIETLIFLCGIHYGLILALFLIIP